LFLLGRDRFWVGVQADLVPEEWGGTVPFVSISAKKGQGIDELLETVALLAEVEEFQANPNRAAEGTVLEAHLNRQVGPVATLLVQAGTLRVCLLQHLLLVMCMCMCIHRLSACTGYSRSAACIIRINSLLDPMPGVCSSVAHPNPPSMEGIHLPMNSFLFE
jgi:hypothetical protein